MSLHITYIQSLKKELLTYAEERRVLIKHCDDALHVSKRAIFAMHRDEMKDAEEKLQTAKELLLMVKKNYPKLHQEGSLKAAMEEFVEASLFFQFLSGKQVGKIKEIPIPSDVYIAGLCDLPGELYRYAIKAATQRNMAMVLSCAQMAESIVSELTSFNLTSYLRNKFDQATSAMHKIEHVVYELSLRT